MRNQSIKFRQAKAGMDQEAMKNLGIEMTEKQQNALTIDFDRMKLKDLAFLEHFPNLNHLSIGGKAKCFDGLEALSKLKDLCLLRLKNDSLEFLKKCPAIEILDIRRGQIKKFETIATLSKLKGISLEGLKTSDLDFIASISSLQVIVLIEVKNIISFPSLKNLVHLRRIHLELLKDLEDIQGIAHASKLKEIIIMETPKLKPESLQCFIGHQSLGRILPGIRNLKSKDYQRACEMFPDKLMDGFYGTQNEGFEFQ